MKIDYLLPRETLKTGAKIHYNKRLVVKYVLFIYIIGLIPAYSMFGEANYTGIAGLYIVLFCLMPLNRLFYAARVSKYTFKAKAKQVPHTV
ncbi:MAG: hypothetical protein ABGY95_00940 [Rubritalea sp.]|uniref:hypothetical protein n=1 Tax=Rubritalea sp. TaxID=2109375 RepID=UPI003241D9FF